MSEEIITETQVPDIAALVEFIAKKEIPAKMIERTAPFRKNGKTAFSRSRTSPTSNGTKKAGRLRQNVFLSAE